MFKVLVLICSMLMSFSSFAEPTIMDFYHGLGCPHCAKVESVLDEFEHENPTLTINRYEVYHNKENAVSLMKKFDEMKVPPSGRGVPILFTDGKYYVGDRDIAKFLFPEVQKKEVPVSSKKEEVRKNPALSLVAIAGAAFVDSINPCAIAVLIILLSALLLQNKKKRALMAGLCFTLSVYMAYFLLGLGLIYTISWAGLSGILYNLIGALAILIGLANLKDFFWYGKGFVMEIPRSWRPRMKKLLNGITSPFGAFLMGFVIMLFELPCTGGPYFFVIGLLSQSMDWGFIIPLLLYYNLVFVLPLLLITFLIYMGLSSADKINELREKYIRQLHLVAGLIMLGLGAWLFLG
ncbi:MAG: cytochrome c biogenesis protein CcdA [Alphaproteobacteria bacterium]|nr:cytochrome c biogenesis protein CcdA [Alphaproteobacteria bacterium]